MNVYYLTILFVVLVATGVRRPALATSAPPGGSTLKGRVRHNWRFAALVAATLAAVSAFRWRVGTDYWQYAENYREYAMIPVGDYSWLNEPGLNLIAKASMRVHDDYATMLGIAAFLTVVLTVSTIYRSSHSFAFSILLYILTGPWQGSFNAVRQYLACAIIFAGHRYILERRPWRYILIVLVASLFHVSALVMVLFYFVPRTRLGLARVISMMLLAVAAATAYTQFLDVISVFRDATGSFVTGSYFLERLNPLRVAVAFAPILFYAFVTVKSRLTSEDHFYVNILFIHAAVIFAASGSAYIARFAIYTGIFAVIALPRLINMEDRRMRVLAMVVATSLYSCFWYIETSGIKDLAEFHWIFDRGQVG